MKKILFFAAFAAAVLCSCNKSEEALNTPAEAPLQTVHFTAGSVETKTVFDTPTGNVYPVKWSGTEKVAINLNLSTATADNVTVDKVYPSSDGKTATFSATFTEKSGNRFVVVSPSVALRGESASNQTVLLEIPSGQVSTESSPDERAQVMAGLSEESEKLPEKVTLSLRHIPAYLHLSFINASLNGGNVKAVNISSEQNIAGRFNCGGDYTLKSEAAMLKAITVSTSSLESVWCALVPRDLSNTTLSFEIVTDQGSLKKSITLGADRKMERGNIYKMTIDMAGVSMEDPKEYTKVTSVDQLHYGDQVVIVAAIDSAGLSTAQNTNNRSGAGVIKVDSGNKVLNISDAVEVITLEDGLKPKQWALKATSATNPGYLYAADTDNKKNYLKTKDAIDASASWAISINPDDKSASILADLENRHNDLRFNAADNLFSAYGSTTQQQKVCIYRKDVPAQDHFVVQMPTYSATIGGVATTLPIYIFSNGAWTASVTGAGSLDFESGTGPKTIMLSVPENPSGVDTRDITVTISTSASVAQSEYEFTMTQAAKPVPASFPILWSMPSPNGNAKNVDYAVNNLSGSYVWSDTHEGKMTVIRTSTTTANSNNTTYKQRSIDSEPRWNGKYCLLHYGIYEGDYWLFEAFNVKNPAGTYTIEYCMESSGNGPKYFLLEYSTDGTNWTPIDPQDGSYESDTFKYTYSISAATTVYTITKSFQLGELSSFTTVSVRARCTSRSRVSGTTMAINHSATNRVGDHISIAFEAE